MAEDAQLVLCNPLCFLINKFANTPAKMLKSALLDFYVGEELSSAKEQLLKDFNTVCREVNISSVPHVPLRREGAIKAQREVDDMFTALNFLDENLVITNLPTYVSDNPDKIPSTRLYEGDFKVIMCILEKMEGRLTSFGSALSAISRDVYTIQEKSKFIETELKTRGVTYKKADVHSSGSGLNIDSNDWPPLSTRAAETVSAQPQMTSQGNSGGLPVIDTATATAAVNSNTTIASTSCVPGDRRKPSDDPTTSLSQAQWSVLASTPVATDNRFSVLADEGNHDEQPFTLVRQQRGSRPAGARSKRGRQESAANGGRLASGAVQTQSSIRQRQRGITGQSAVASLGLWASKKTISKAVFCVDNVGMACNDSDIRAHVSSMGMQVFSCFETKPRRRPHESADDVKDRKAFRLCTSAADRERILDPSIWPESIRVSEWFSFRQRNNNPVNVDKRRRISISESESHEAGKRAEVTGGGQQQDSVARSGGDLITDQLMVAVDSDIPTTSADVVVMDIVDNDQTTIGDDGDDDDVEIVDRTTIYRDGEHQ